MGPEPTPPKSCGCGPPRPPRWTKCFRHSVRPASGPSTGACDISGDTLVVGAYTDAQAGFESGAVFVFERIAGTWTETARIVANAATELTLDAALNLVAGDEYRITDPATLGILGSTFTADRLAFQRVGSTVTVAGIELLLPSEAR